MTNRNRAQLQQLMELASSYEAISQEMFALAARMEKYPRYNPESELYGFTKFIEKNAVKQRSLTARFLAPANRELYETIAAALDIEIVEERKWIKIVVPAILPGRNARDGSLFITQPLRNRLIEFQRKNPIERFAMCTICILHKYDEALGVRRVRDYDNVETKRFLDVIESVLLTNDSGLYCSVFQTTQISDRDRTEFYLMQPETLPIWLEKHIKTDTKSCTKNGFENGIDFKE